MNDQIITQLISGITEISISHNTFTPREVKVETITVKLLSNFMSSEQLCKYWNKMSMGNGTWNNLKIVSTQTADYYVIVNKPLYSYNEYYLPSKTMVLQMEPDCDTNPFFNDWYKHRSDFLYFLEFKKFHNNGEWWLSLNNNELREKKIIKEEEKDDILSTIISSKYDSFGHKLRIDFVKYLEKNNNTVAIYGFENKFNFRNYLGALPHAQKENGLFPYKYTFIAENTSIYNYLTEKLLDSILSECVCFYWGCPNVSDFFSEKSFIYLPLDQENGFEKSLKIIKTSIEIESGKRESNLYVKIKKSFWIIIHFFREWKD